MSGSLEKPLTAAWELLNACDYRCPYCFFIPGWKNAPEEQNGRHLACSADDWLGFWGRLHDLHGSFEVIVAGGEPFYYPGFVPLIARFAAWHRASVVTNLSCDVSEILGRLDPERVRLSVSYHPHFAELGAFVEKAARLKAGGFEIAASVVSYPPLFERLPEFVRALDSAGIACWVNVYQGEFNGKTYPDAFTPEQKEWIYGTHPHEPREAFDHGAGILRPYGKTCAAGQRYFRAYPDGWVYRCAPVHDLADSAPIGNIKDRDFRLPETPAPCPAQFCGCSAEYRYLEPARV